MKIICPVDSIALTLDFIPFLAGLPWRASGVRPWDGSYGMLAWPFPEPLHSAAHRLIGQILSEHFAGHIRGTTFLARLVPGQRVPPHVDAEDHACPFRVHIPLVTNPQATFTTDLAEFHLSVGHAYLIDPTAEHSAYNGGTTDRIHLLFNVVPA